MKAPKLLVALGLVAPIFAQSCDHCRSHASQSVVDSNVDSASHVAAHDTDLHHRDYDKPPPTIPQNIPFHPPQPASIERRDSDDALAASNDPPKHRCNPISPFCVDPPSSERSGGEHVEGHEKRDLDTSDGFDSSSAEHSQKVDHPPSGANIADLYDIFWDNTGDCFEHPERCWKSSAIQHGSSDHVDSTQTLWKPWVSLSEYVKCSYLADSCAGNVSCACDMLRQCGSSGNASALTSMDVLRCTDKDSPSATDEASADLYFRCYAVDDAGDVDADCVQEWWDPCHSSRPRGPQWSELESCAASYSSTPHHGHGHKRNEVPDSFPAQRSQVPDYSPDASDFDGDTAWMNTFLDDLSVCYKYPELCWKHADGQYVKREDTPISPAEDPLPMMLSVEWPMLFKCQALEAYCEDDHLPCACNLATRCSQPQTSALTSREVMTCIGGKDSRFGIESQADKAFRCKFVKGACKETRDPCVCGLTKQCSNESGAGPSYDAIVQCSGAFDNHDNDAGDDSAHFVARDLGDVESRAGRRRAQEDVSLPTDLPLESLSGAAFTMTWYGGADTMSVLKASPLVVEHRNEEGHYTLVDSAVRTNPAVHVVTGIADGEEITKTIHNNLLGMLNTGYDKKDIHASPTASPARRFSEQAGEAVTYNVLGGTAAISVAEATPNVVVATYGDESESGTLVASAIETDPPAVAFSGAWDDEPIPATTVALSPDVYLDDFVDDVAYDLEEDLDLDDLDLGDLDLDDASELVEDYLGKSSSMAKRDRDAEFGTDVAQQAIPSTSTASVVVLGNSSAPYFRTTDAQGRPIYVKSTGEHAANSKTLTFSASVEPASTTRQGGFVEYSVITKTVRPTTTIDRHEVVEYRVVTTTKTVYGERSTPHKTPVLADKTVVDLGTTQVPCTKNLQTVNSTAMRFAHPQATLMPLIWKAAYSQGFEHLFHHDEFELTHMFAGHDVDWDGARQMSYQLREENSELVPELNFHKALIMHLRSQRGDPAPYASITSLNKHNVDQYFKPNATVAWINGTRYSMNHTMKTINGTPVVIDPLMQYQKYNARHHRVVPTPACVGNKGVFGLLGGRGKKECEIEKCMWKHMRPLEIQTVFPAAMRDAGCGQFYDYFTQKTRLEDPHWGTTESRGTYYPVAWGKTCTKVTTTRDRTKSVTFRPTCALKRQYPDGFDPQRNENRGIHGDPVCSDMKTCHEECVKHHGFSLPKGVLLALAIGLPLLFGLPLLLLLCCCLPAWGLHRRRRRQNQDPNRAAVNNEKERRPSVMDKIRRKSTGQPDGVVNAVTGQATDPATGRAIEGGPGAASAIAASSAAGAAAAAAGGGGSGEGKGDGSATGGAGGSGAGGPGGADASTITGGGDPVTKVIGGGEDGKGTLGRQAEEGRSRVHFDEAPKAVSDAEPHVEAVGGPPKTDGTIESASGREWADVGSMRGRKRARPEGQGLNLGF